MHSTKVFSVLEVQARPLEQSKFGRCSPILICFSSFGEVPSGLTKVPSTFAKYFNRTGVRNAISLPKIEFKSKPVKAIKLQATSTGQNLLYRIAEKEDGRAVTIHDLMIINGVMTDE